MSVSHEKSKMGRDVSNTPLSQRGKGSTSDTPTLPSGWRWRTVGEMAENIQYGTSAKTGADEKGVPVIRMGNIQDGALLLDSLKYLPATHDEFPELLLRDGDLLFNRTNSSELVGKSAVYRGNPPRASFASYLIRAQLKPEYVPEFLAYYINSPHGRQWVSSVVSQQVGQANVNGTKLKALRVPVPPLPEQRRIVAEIERQFTRLDAGVAALRRTQANLKRYRASVIEDTLAVDWPKMKISDIGEIVTGTTPTPTDDDNYSGYLPFVTPADLNAGYYLNSATRHLTSKGAKLARPLPERSVLVTCIGATIGKTGLARSPCATNQQINAFIPHDMAVSPEWAYWMFSSPSGQQQIHKNASATTLPILNKTRFGMLKIPVPPLELQAQLVAEIERKLTIADTIQESLVGNLTRADRLRRTLLEAAFEGRLFTI